jgi:hypothetical protein
MPQVTGLVRQAGYTLPHEGRRGGSAGAGPGGTDQGHQSRLDPLAEIASAPTTDGQLLYTMGCPTEPVTTGRENSTSPHLALRVPRVNLAAVRGQQAGNGQEQFCGDI